jgi:hypothetical protein
MPETVTAPGLDAIQAALHKTTEGLAAELANPAVAAPDWSDLEWRVARAAAAIHGVSGLLAASQRWSGPAAWSAFLADQRDQVARRGLRIRAVLDALDVAARARAVPVMALKGAALNARGIYAAGERPMSDIDLLVSSADLPRTQELLEALGYRAGVETFKHRTFEAAHEQQPVHAMGEDAGASIKIELHAGIRERLPLRVVDISAAILPARAAAGLNDYPCGAARMLHILLHAAGAMVLRELRLLHLSDIARICALMSQADWDEVFSAAQRTDEPTVWWAYPPLALTQRYFGGVPAEVLARTARACPPLLRRFCRDRTLTSVSFSYPWISAFPGIEWVRSPSQFAEYAGRRLVPSRQTMALRDAFAQSQPQVSGGNWAHTSQGRRIMRWLTSRPPRQGTIQAVRAALAS